MSDLQKINLDTVSGVAAHEFSELYNALIDAGWAPNFAAETAKIVVGRGINIKCDCKN